MDTQEIKKLAELSRLQINEKELADYQKDFEGILAYIETISSFEVQGFDDHTRSMTTNRMREDDNAYPEGTFSEKLLHASPRKDGDYFKVNKIL